MDDRALNERDVDPDPFAQFAVWYREAADAGIRAPEAAAVATATPEGRPSVRMVLVKRVDARGFVFFTNYASRKGTELAANPFGALMFYWEPVGRQVRIEGPVARTSPQETADYVRTRPRGSQLSALASPQSRPVNGRGELEQRVAELEARYGSGAARPDNPPGSRPDAELPLPESWGGFRLTPQVFEFWQQRQSRLHDRLVYRSAGDGGWQLQRLAP